MDALRTLVEMIGEFQEFDGLCGARPSGCCTVAAGNSEWDWCREDTAEIWEPSPLR